MRLMINEEVCEGCGDCVKQSNCMSLTPVHDRARPEDAHSSVLLQQGLFVRAGRLPVVRHREDQAGHRSDEETAADAAPDRGSARRAKWLSIGDGYRIVCPASAERAW